MERLVNLPSTESLRTQRELLVTAWAQKTAPGTPQEREVRQRLTKLDRDLEEALRRDELQAERPTGCFCLGTGRTPYWSQVHDRGLGTWCWCPDGNRVAEQTQTEQRSYEVQRVISQRAEVLAAIGIPTHFESFTLDTFIPEEMQTHVHGQMVRWASGEGGSVFLFGEASRGKTGLCLAALRARVEREVRGGAYWDATALLTELIRGIRDHESDAADPVERAERVRYLLLDDIDKIAETPFKLQTIYDLVNKRHNKGLVTLFTANCGLQALSKKLGNWTADRIVEMCGPEWVMELKGSNRRTGV